MPLRFVSALSILLRLQTAKVYKKSKGAVKKAQTAKKAEKYKKSNNI